MRAWRNESGDRTVSVTGTLLYRILRCVEMKAYLYVRLNNVLQGHTILACCIGLYDPLI